MDNILDLKYFKTLLPELARQGARVSLFYETKSNLKKDQVRLLRDAGVTMIQPGIESFSDEVLKLMKKGVSGLQNIQLLKWCKEIGVEPLWNFLLGFPGESPDEYQRDGRPRRARLPPAAPGRRHRHPPRPLQPEFQRGRSARLHEACGRCPSTSSSTTCRRPRAGTSRTTSRTSTAGRRTSRATRSRWCARVHAWSTTWRHAELLSVEADDRLVIADTRPGRGGADHRC